MDKPTKDIDQMNLSELKGLIESLQSKIRIYVIVGGIALSLLTSLGYNKISDIEKSVRDRIDATVKKETEYFDLIIQGMSRMNAYQWSSAIGYLESARSLRPDDELLFTSLLNCYVNSAELDSALLLVEEAENKNLFNTKLHEFWSHLNVGRLLTLLAISQPNPETIKKAKRYLSRAQRIVQLQKGGEISYVLYAQAILYYTQGDAKFANDLLEKVISIDPRARDWPKLDWPDPWYQLILEKHPNFYNDFERVLNSTGP